MSENGTDGLHTQREWRSLPERIKRVWLLRSVLTDTAVVLVCVVLASIFIASDWWGFWQALVLGLIAAWAVLELATQPLQTRYAYRFTRFSIGERDLKLHTGWLFRKSVTVPFNRVQHVDTKQGPLLRSFAMTSVSVHTAVGEHEIEAVDDAEAMRIVELITSRVLAVKEDL
ncbi:PH domain-containing protein [uncultured Bifidobacterium sp.]|uniref:PH domain-containing protein n=1 Tax=uncultured Bifidobacterium sp. TaxID=165187 RepID=UPI00259A3BAC|nr:PH domain-containing protein [uncultured Bifidobacterium sp.]